jgi:hypothetical protein
MSDTWKDFIAGGLSLLFAAFILGCCFVLGAIAMRICQWILAI